MDTSFVQPYYYQTASSISLAENQESQILKEKLAQNLKIMESGPGLRDSCSDTDSGICADSGSETQLSPKQISAKCQQLLVPGPGNGHCLLRPKHLPNLPLCNLPQAVNNSQWKLRKPPQNNGFPSSSGCSDFSGSLPKKPQPLRVRFADEIPETTDSRATNSLAVNNKTVSDNNNSKFGTSQSNSGYYYFLSRSQKCNNNLRPVTQPSGQTNFSGAQISNARQNQDKPAHLTIETKNGPPPPYFAAIDRIEELKNRQLFFAETRNRSASLPRNCTRYRANEDARIQDRNYVPNMRERATNFVLQGTGLSSAKSVDNLHIQQARAQNGANFKNVCVLPANSCNDIVRLDLEKGVVVPQSVNQCRIQKPIRSQQNAQPQRFTQYMKRFATNALHKFGSDEHLGRAKSLPPAPQGRLHVAPQPGNFNLADRKLQIRLLGLDSCGVQTLEIEKLEPGPFGFYIATGMYKRKKGIFISRVNARCLSQLISIGDQLLEVDAVPTKGKTLEQVQTMIANKQKIILKILPVIMR